MSIALRCSQVTRRGRPCRNPALPGSNPPACRRHARLDLARASQARLGFYDAYLSADELEALDREGRTTGVESEVTLVRVMLRRLLARYDACDDDAARKLASLVFTGTRTLALLLRGRTNDESGFNEWLNRLLDDFGDEIGVRF